MTTLGAAAGSRVISRVASSPSMPGIRMSMSTTSGPWAAACDTGRLAVGGLADHGDAVGGVEDDAESRADQLLVVDDEHPDRRGRGSAVIALAAAR